jgi:DNA-directed RNA polymerase specialized sigma24 family protein
LKRYVKKTDYEMSFQEIADAMGITVSKVRVIYRSAITKLENSGKLKELYEIMKDESSPYNH